MALDILNARGVPLERQVFDWRDLVRTPISKLDDDAFTRARILVMSSIEADSMRSEHALARTCSDLDLRRDLASVRRVEQHQQTLVGWLLPPDQSPLETTVAVEQALVEVLAGLAEREPDPYVAQVLRFGLLEDLDHLYRFSALLDRLEGKDPNTILQSHTDIRPGRPTAVTHRAPADDVRTPYDRHTAKFMTKVAVRTALAMAERAHDFYMDVGPTFADPAARLLYAEIASVKEQHQTQYASLLDPDETWLEAWLLGEATEVYHYQSCLESESDGRVKAVWQRFVDYELGHLHHVLDLMQRLEGRDADELLPAEPPALLDYVGHRESVRRTLANEVGMVAIGTQLVNPGEASPATIAYRDQLNGKGSPSSAVAAGYCWAPGTELAARARRRAATTEARAA